MLQNGDKNGDDNIDDKDDDNDEWYYRKVTKIMQYSFSIFGGYWHTTQIAKYAWILYIVDIFW